MPHLAIDLATRDGRLRLVYAAIVSACSAPWPVALSARACSIYLARHRNCSGRGSRSGALLLFGWRVLPAILLALMAELVVPADLPAAWRRAWRRCGRGAGIPCISQVSPLRPAVPQGRRPAALPVGGSYSGPALAAAVYRALPAPAFGSPLQRWFAWAIADATSILVTVAIGLIWVTPEPGSPARAGRSGLAGRGGAFRSLLATPADLADSIGDQRWPSSAWRPPSGPRPTRQAGGDLATLLISAGRCWGAARVGVHSRTCRRRSDGLP